VANSAQLVISKNGKTGWWDLVSIHDSSATPRTMIPRIMKSIPSQHDNKEYNEKSWPQLYDALDLRPEKEQDSDIWCGFWPEEGLRYRDIKSGDYSGIALGIPLMMWPARNATVLPGDIVVFELGPQVVVFNLKTRKIGLLAFGHGPVAVLENEGLSSEK
jgi:hypothetical protein